MSITGMRNEIDQRWHGSAECAAQRDLVRLILRNSMIHPDMQGWTVQGMGMLRCYLDAGTRFRLNIWDRRLQIPKVSMIHDHPWSFDSWVVNGRFSNQRFEFTEGYTGYGSPLYDYMVIKTGEGGGPTGIVKHCTLKCMPMEHYNTGDRYHQDPTEVHYTAYTSGSVTLNDRTRVGDGEHARVFWPAGEQWVDAFPRKATNEEVTRTVGGALHQWTEAI